MELEGNPAPPEPSRGMQTCSLSTTSVPTPGLHLRSLMGPTHRWRVDIFIDIGSNDRLGRLDFAEGLSYRLRHSRRNPRLCWDGSLKWVLLQEGSHFTDDVLGVRLAHLCCNESGLDANILQEVVNGTNHLGCQRRSMFTMGELLFSEEERVQDRGGGKVNAERWASEFGVKDWVEAVWGALSGSRVKFLDRLLIISYYQVMAVTETKVIILACWMASNTGTVGCTTAASWLSPVCRWWCDWWHQVYTSHVCNFKRNGKTIDASGKTIYAQYE